MTLLRLPAEREELTGRLAAVLIIAWSPFSGGPRVPGLILALLGGWLLAREGRSIYESVAQRRLALLFLLFWVPVALSVPGAVAPLGAAKVALVLPLYYLAGVALVYVLRRGEAALWLQGWISVVLLLWVGDSLVQYATGADLLGTPLSPGGRVVGPFGDNLRQATFLAVLLPLMLWWVMDRRALLALLVYVLTSFVVFLSGARGTWVMALLAGVLFLWHLRLRFKTPVLLVLLLLAALAASQSQIVTHKLHQSVAGERVDFETVNDILSDRLIIWETGWRMLAHRPLTGVGASGFDKAYERYAYRAEDPFLPGSEAYSMPVYHAHHMFVAVAAETGLIGLAGLLLIWGLCLKWYLAGQDATKAQARPFALALLVASFPLNSMPILLTNWWMPVILLLVCLLLASLDPAPAAQQAPVAPGRAASRVSEA